MTTIEVLDLMAQYDGDIIQQLRTLRDDLASGAIDRAEYDRQFQALDRLVGVACSLCGHVPAVIRPLDKGPAFCGRCVLAGAVQ